MSIDPTNSKAGIARGGWFVTATDVARLALAVSLSGLAVMTASLMSPQDAKGAVPDCATAANARTWVGPAKPASGDWGTAANWSNTGSQPPTPGPNEIACIGDATVNFNVAAEVDAVVSGPDGTLAMPSGFVLRLSPQAGEESQVANVTGERLALAGAGDLIVTKNLISTLGFDTLAGPAGSKLILAAPTPNTPNALISAINLDGRTLVVANGRTVTNPGGILQFSNGASIENSGVWDATADGTILQPLASPGSEFRNRATGILKKTGGSGNTSVNARVVNDGLIVNATATNPSPGILGLGPFSGGNPAAGRGKVVIGGSGVTVTGSGRFEPGVFQAFGTVAPGASAGTLQVTGAPGGWELGSAERETPTLRMEIGGTGAGQFDQLALAGPLILPGPASFATLELSTLPGYTPVVGDQFAIVTGSAGFSGEFPTVTGTDLGGGKSFQVTYETNRVLVKVVGPDTTAPSVTIDQAAGQQDPTSASPINFTAVFSEPVTGFATGDVTLSGSAGATTATVSEIAPTDGTTYNVAVSGMTGPGTVIADIPANVAMDAGRNPNTASTSTDKTVTFEVVNQSPDAVDDSATVAEDSGANTIDVLANDSDPEGDPLEFTGITQPANGTASCSDVTKNCTYTPAANFHGSDSFTYSITDQTSSDTATVNITVTSVNDPPDAVDDSATVAEDSGANQIAVLANDSDLEKDPLSISSNTQPSNGSASCTASSCSYTPAANFNGNDSFTYTISDGNGGSDTATVNITVTPVDEPPNQAPSCNGVAATIYVGADGRIVGGPDNGAPYRGKLNGTPGPDVMVGTPNRDEFAARGGNDLLCGGEGNDELEAGGGSDTVLGEGGNDILAAGGGNDSMTGGPGADRFMGGTGTDRATDYTPAQGDTKTGVEIF